MQMSEGMGIEMLPPVSYDLSRPMPAFELRFLAAYLFGGPAGPAAARKVDEIRRLPGFETVQLLESWMDRHDRHAMPSR